MPVTEFKSVTVTVPATTANIGPGFDCLGAALSLYNQFTFALTAGETQIHVTGLESDRVQTDRQNLAYQAFSHFYQHLGQTPPPVNLHIQLGVPLARGLGSSATAIVGGLVGANALAGQPLSQPQVLDLAIAMEGHPDNVAPALMGGCCLAATGTTSESWVISTILWSAVVTPIIAIPDFELSTHAARQVLPQTCSYADAIFNTAHLGLLLRGLETGRPDWLEAALQDRLHQPYRENLIPGYEAVRDAAVAAGAYGLVISGAGPTLLALSSPAKADQVAVAMQTAWETVGVMAEAKWLLLDYQGAIAQPVESPI
jgi:homoserine kinase